MRNIRIADPNDRLVNRPTPPSATPHPVRDKLATLPILLLVPVLLLPLLAVWAGAPNLKVRPGSAAAGSAIDVAGTGFGRGDSGVVVWDDATVLGRYRTTGSGNFRIRVTVPADAPAGSHRIDARHAAGESPKAMARLIVAGTADVSESTPDPTAAPTAPPPSATPIATPAPTPGATAIPGPTATPGPVAPAPTPTPAPIATPRPTATPSPTATPPPATPPPAPQAGYILMSRSSLLALPTSGDAWTQVVSWANKPVATVNLSDQNDNDDIVAFAKGLVYARTGTAHYRDEAIAMLRSAVGTEYPGDTLGVARNFGPLVLAADLVGYRDSSWMAWVAAMRTWRNPDRDYSLVSMHEKRPNNWGTHAGAGRIAADLYLGDSADLARAALVFRGYIGDRAAYAGFAFGETSWQCDPARPVGINPAGCTRNGFSLDGVIPDDMRRGGTFPSIGTDGVSYTWEGLQGVLLQAELLSRAGYGSWEWEDRAVLRAFRRINALGYTATGDDLWQPWLIDRRFGTSYATASSRPGKSFGFTDWLYRS